MRKGRTLRRMAIVAAVVVSVLGGSWIFAAAIEPKQLWLVERAGHVDLERVNPVEYQERIAKFFKESFISKSGRHGFSL